MGAAEADELTTVVPGTGAIRVLVPRMMLGVPEIQVVAPLMRVPL